MIRAGVPCSASLSAGWRVVACRVMSTVAEIESAIAQLSRREAEEVREWLEQWLEDQQEMTPQFLASIERGKADLAAGRIREELP